MPFKQINKTKSIMIGFAIMMLFSCNNSYEEVNKVTTNELTPVVENFNTTITYTVLGNLHSKIISPHIQRYMQGDTSWTIMPEGITALFYDSLMQVESQMESEYGIWYQNEAKMIAEKDVRIFNNQGEKLNTEKLIWYQDSGIFVTDEFVKITQPTGVIYGKGLRATESFDSYEITEITGNIAIQE